MNKWFLRILGIFSILFSLQAVAQAKIAVIDYGRLQQETKEGARISQTLKAFKESKQNDINAKKAELQALQDKLSDPKFSDDKKAEWANLYRQKGYEAEAFVKAADEEMQDKADQAAAEFLGKVADVVKKYASDKGYSIIVDKRVCIFSSDTLDITSEIIKAMDAASTSSSAPSSKK